MYCTYTVHVLYIYSTCTCTVYVQYIYCTCTCTVYVQYIYCTCTCTYSVIIAIIYDTWRNVSNTINQRDKKNNADNINNEVSN